MEFYLIAPDADPELSPPIDDDHECEWVDAVEGPDVVGKVCAVCGEPYDYSGELDE